MANVKVFAHKQTDKPMGKKNYMPPVYRCGDITKIFKSQYGFKPQQGFHNK